MATTDFDFKELEELKMAQYKKEYCKPAIVKKAKAALIMLDFKLKGKKTPCVLVSFKKPAEAAKAFKKLKADKAHVLKKTGLCKVSVVKGEDGKPEITVDIRKGGLNPGALMSKGKDLFENTLKMKLKVNGGATEEATEENVENQESKGGNDADEKNKKVIVAKLNAKIAKIKENASKIEEAISKSPNEKTQDKILENILKYKNILRQMKVDALTIDTEDSETIKEIDGLQGKMELLKEKVEKLKVGDESEPKKITPERKMKIKENMGKIEKKLESIIKALGMS
jgi:hypothetical protein